MSVGLEQLIFQNFERHQSDQKEIKDILESLGEEIAQIAQKYFQEILRLKLVAGIRENVEFETEIYFSDINFIVKGKHSGKNYAFNLADLDNDEVGWNITSVNDEGVVSNREYPLDDLSLELLKIMGRYEAMSEAESEQSADDEADLDADLTAEKEE